jgi:septum formation protein
MVPSMLHNIGALRAIQHRSPTHPQEDTLGKAKMLNLVLASASPRRRELLTQAGFTFAVHPAHIPEDPHPNEDPIAYVIRLAREKAHAVFNQLSTTSESANPQMMGAPGLDFQTWESTNPGAPAFSRSVRKGWETVEATASGERASAPPLVVLGADTTVTIDGLILGKPENLTDATRMLRMLSGRTHRVITGVAVVTAAHTEVAAEVTGVKFLTLSEEEIAAYVATGEPMDKAGAYAIQGHAARWIPRIEGDYFNVVGLPIALVYALLESRAF